jgi:hypothetical protein
VADPTILLVSTSDTDLITAGAWRDGIDDLTERSAAPCWRSSRRLINASGNEAR